MPRIFEIWPFENDPNRGPQRPAEQGRWTWWRTGPHPMGRYQAMDWTGDFGAAFSANRAEFPIVQDAALDEGSSFAGISCHACDYWTDGSPSGSHTTACDGICRLPNCSLHGEIGRQIAFRALESAHAAAQRAGLSKADIIAHIRSL